MRDRDYDVAALANNLSQAFRYGIYSNDDIEEVSSFHLILLSCVTLFCLTSLLMEPKHEAICT